MSDRSENRTGQNSREERLRQALRANLQRRKAQARARADHAEGPDDVAEDTGSKTGRDDN
ncbi:MAG: hypothetical protein ACK4YU_06435 [Paracoccus sp. (in: a-proteobacteria)]